MLIVETIRKIRHAHHRQHKSIRQIARDFNMSRNTVKKVLRSDATEFSYSRSVQPRAKLAEFEAQLTGCLVEDRSKKPKHRRSMQILFEQLQRDGFTGGYDSVRRFVRQWQVTEGIRLANVFIPLTFAPGEAFQFDWSEEDVELSGVPMKVKVAQFRLCHSRMPFCVAYTREALEMVMHAHVQAFAFYGGSCERGIYDNLKAVVAKILLGKDRVFTRRFLSLASHYLFEPVACTPAAGWEKGQVENQVDTVRQRFFNQRRTFADLEELNAWLVARCRQQAGQKHPEFQDRTIAEVFQEEQPALRPVALAFDGYVEHSAGVSRTALVAFDRNHYSVDASAVGVPVTVRAYADQVVFAQDSRVVGVHPRQFGRGKTIYNPWHYLEVLQKKPGALRNGAPFKDWDLPEALQAARQELARRSGGDRQFVEILASVATYGMEAVAAACATARDMHAISRDVVLNLLTRSNEEAAPPPAVVPAHLPDLKFPPLADCHRYNLLLAGGRYGTA